MIKDNNNYLYLIVPNEYRCVYYNILDTLGTLGEDLLSSCTATCKGRAISGFACYNMFIAACAAYYLGQVKRARVLISYIKAQLEINCNKFIVFEDSSKDEWVFLKVPKAYQCVFEKLLNKLATWGQELLDDCTTSCKGKNKNILISWNLFNAACIGYEGTNVCKSDEIINYINSLLSLNCPIQTDDDSGDDEGGDTPEFAKPVLTNFKFTYTVDEDNSTINIINGSVNIQNINNIQSNSLKLINLNTGNILVDNLPVSQNINFNLQNVSTLFGSDINYVLEVKGTDNLSYRSNIFTINIPVPSPDPDPGPSPDEFAVPALNIDNIDYELSEGSIESKRGLKINGFTATCDNPQSINSDGLTLKVGYSDDILTNITPAANIEEVNINFEKEIQRYGMTIIRLLGTGTDGNVYSASFMIDGNS